MSRTPTSGGGRTRGSRLVRVLGGTRRESLTRFACPVLNGDPHNYYAGRATAMEVVSGGEGSSGQLKLLYPLLFFLQARWVSAAAPFAAEASGRLWPLRLPRCGL